MSRINIWVSYLYLVLIAFLVVPQFSTADAGKGILTKEPSIFISITSLDSSNVTEGSSSFPKELTIYNTGNADLNISGMNISDTTNFSLDTGGGTNPCGSTSPTIWAGDSCTITVIFTLSSTGTSNAILTINSDVLILHRLLLTML